MYHKLTHQVTVFSALVGSFGLIGGIITYVRYMRDRLARHAQGNTYKIDIPGDGRSVLLRKGTSDFYVFYQIFVRNDYEISNDTHKKFCLETYERILNSGKKPLIIDCGANIGLGTLYFRQIYNRAVIYAIEPEKDNFSILRLNISGLSEVVAVRAGIWDRKANLSIANKQDAAWMFQTRESNETDEEFVQAMTIEEIIGGDIDHELFIVKVDIEGSESKVFGGSNGWVDNAPVIIVEIHDWLLPWKATGHDVFCATTRRKRDYVISGENMFCFLHPDAS